MRAFSNPWTLLAAAALPAVVGAALLAMRLPSGDSSSARTPLVAAPIVSARFVCSFANEDAAAALVQGADGGQSVVVGDRSYWLFGDTLFAPESGKQIEANTIAWSEARDRDGCPQLTYHARGGIAQPFIPKDGSLTVWPSAAVATDDGSIDMFTIYVYGSGPYAYWIGEIGVARVNPATMQTEVLARSLWDADTGFASPLIGAQPIDVDGEGRLRVVLHMVDDRKLLARAPRDAIADARAYEYWDGNGWSSEPASAAPLWHTSKPDDPVQRLAAYEGGVQITWSDAFDAYIAITNADYATIGVRFADQLEGPWSDIVPWIDCTAIAEPRVPVCYAPAIHPQFSGDDSLFVTLTRFGEYDVVAYELTPGVPVHEYRSNATLAYGFDAPDGDWEDLGVAFQASRTAAPDLSPIYEWRRDDELAFAAASPGDGFERGDARFYVPLINPPTGSPLGLRPVYAWSDGSAHMLSTMATGLEQYGFARGDIAFYAP